MLSQDGNRALVDLLDGGFEAHLVDLGFDTDLGEQGAADAVGFDERGWGAFAAGEVGAGGTLILEGFQLICRLLEGAFVAGSVCGEGL